MQKFVRSFIAILIISGGVILFNYPTIATFVNNLFAYREISEYTEAANSLDQAALDEELALAHAYNEALPMSFPADPFSSTNIRNFTGTDFESFDLVQNGAMIGYLEIPEINLYQPVYYGTSNEVLDKGLGLVENTSLPVGGTGTHAVISGHTGMATRKLFTNLDEMKNGDLFFIHVLNQHFAYQVDQIEVVLPEQTEDLAIEKGQDYVTLVTCTPFGINDHRLLVRGSRVDYDFSEKEKEPALLQAYPAYRKWLLILGAGLAVIILFIIKVVRDLRKER
ncbi:MAG: class C sortase [Eubacterium sp.]|nr:class C sortase [Eubacterium sp.]